jgi:hypothetical protein
MDPADDPAADPRLRAELEAARSWGVSWRRFCGWEPTVTTTFEYDPAGRLLRSVTVTEPEWDDIGRAAVYALMRLEADLCPGCSQPLAVTAAKENEFRWREGASVRCHRCVAAEVVQKSYEGDPHPTALLIAIELKPEDDDG